MVDARPKIRRMVFLNLFVGLMLLFFAGAGFVHGYRQVKREVLLVLTFHGVTDQPMRPWEIPWSQLTQILDGLQRHDFTPLPPRDFPAWWKGEISGGRRYLVTFDDGLRTSAAAIRRLKTERNLDSVFFLVTDLLGTPEYVSQEDVAALASGANCVIGLHGKRHVEPPHLASQPGVLCSELQEAGRILRELSGQPVTWYAYPYGEYDDRSQAVVASAGLSFGFTIDARDVSREDHVLLVPRLMYLRGVEKTGEPTPEDWMPPQSARTGSLTVTLGMLVLMLGIRMLYGAMLARRKLAGQ